MCTCCDSNNSQRSLPTPVCVCSAGFAPYPTVGAPCRFVRLKERAQKAEAEIMDGVGIACVSSFACVTVSAVCCCLVSGLHSVPGSACAGTRLGGGAERVQWEAVDGASKAGWHLGRVHGRLSSV